MRTPLDWVASYLSLRSRRFAAAASASDEATWLNHSLVTVLLFGGTGGVVGRLHPHWGVVYGFRWGVLFGAVFYLVREVMQRWDRQNWRVNLWDGILDVLTPWWVASAIVFPDQLWICYSLTVAMVLLVFVFRPIPGDSYWNRPTP